MYGRSVELGEIEEILANHPAIQDVMASVVMDEDRQQPMVVAYATQADLNVEAILESGRTQLPNHMVPDAVLPLEALPLLPSGKASLCNSPSAMNTPVPRSLLTLLHPLLLAAVPCYSHCGTWCYCLSSD